MADTGRGPPFRPAPGGVSVGEDRALRTIGIIGIWLHRESRCGRMREVAPVEGGHGRRGQPTWSGPYPTEFILETDEESPWTRSMRSTSAAR